MHTHHLVSLLREKYKQLRYRGDLPREIYNSDLFVVEFPKSGITWLTTILANIYTIVSQRNISPTYFNLEQLIGDVHHSRRISSPNSFPFFRTIKSHARYNPYYRNVIYIIRNPFSVMESYYAYLTAQGKFTGSFDEFVRHDVFGVRAWCSHVSSWVEPERELNFHLLRYEDLKQNEVVSIQKLCSNLGLNVSENIIETAIKNSSFEAMKQSAELFRMHSPAREYNFVRKGKGNSEIEISSDTRSYIIGESEKFLKLLYPEMLGSG